jgi:hypothetical protein
MALTIKSRRLINSLGQPVKESTYSIKADEKGVWWIIHDQVGSGEPLSQWLDSQDGII